MLRLSRIYLFIDFLVCVVIVALVVTYYEPGGRRRGQGDARKAAEADKLLDVGELTEEEARREEELFAGKRSARVSDPAENGTRSAQVSDPAENATEGLPRLHGRARSTPTSSRDSGDLRSAGVRGQETRAQRGAAGAADGPPAPALAADDPFRAALPGADPFAAPTADSLAAPPTQDKSTPAEPPRPPASRPRRLLLLTKPPAEGAESGPQPLEKRLDRPVTVDVAGVPLGDVLAALSRQCGVKIEPDPGVPAATPVRFEGVHLPLRRVLDGILAPLGLRWTIDGERLRIAAAEEDDAKTSTIEYPLGDLAAKCSDGDKKAACRTLADVVEGLVGNLPDEPAVVLADDGVTLRVTGGRETHAAVSGLLAALGEAAEHPVDKSCPPLPPDPLEAALAQPVTVRFVDVPLDEAIESLSKSSGIPIRLDRAALADCSIEPSQPVSLEAQGISVGSVLSLVVGRLGLAPWCRYDVLLIGDPRADGLVMAAKLYPIGDLAVRRDESGQLEYRQDEVIDLLKSIISPMSWSDFRGPAQVVPVSTDRVRAVAILQTRDNHREIADLLAALRQVASDTAAHRSQTRYPLPSPGDRAVEVALARKLTVDFNRERLESVLTRLGQLAEVNMIIDRKALAEVRLSCSTLVTFRARDLSLRAILRSVLRDLGLTYLVEWGSIVVTLPENAKEPLETRVYPVKDWGAGCKSEGERCACLDGLTSLITTIAGPFTWHAVGGPGVLRRIRFENLEALVVRQTSEVHEEIERLLLTFRGAARDVADGKPKPYYACWAKPEDTAVEKALEQTVSLHCENEPLDTLVRRLAETYGLDVQFEAKTLSECENRLKTPISLDVGDITLRSALQLVLLELNLGCYVEDGSIWIAAPETAAFPMCVTIFPVNDLLTADKRDEDAAERIRSLIQWTMGRQRIGLGGECVRASAGLMITCHARGEQEEIVELLAALRRIDKQASKGEEHIPNELVGSSRIDTAARKRIQAAMDEKVSFHVREKRLAEVVDKLEELANINILLAPESLFGAIPKENVSLDVEGLPLRATLKLLLDPLNFCCKIRDEVLLLCPRDRLFGGDVICVYPVGDLVVCRDENGDLWDDYKTLVERIKTTVAPDTWTRDFLPAAIVGFSSRNAKVLVVSQSDEVHQQVARLLADLRAVAAKHPGDKEPPRRKRPEKPVPPEKVLPKVPAGGSGGGFF